MHNNLLIMPTAFLYIKNLNSNAQKSIENTSSEACFGRIDKKYALLPSKFTKLTVVEHTFLIYDQNADFIGYDSHFLGRAVQFFLHRPGFKEYIRN